MLNLNISGCNKITDEGIKCISKLKLLTILNISNCDKITDEGIKYISELLLIDLKITNECFGYLPKILTKIYFSGMITDERLEYLTELKSIINNEGFKYLLKFHQLEWITIFGCKNLTYDNINYIMLKLDFLFIFEIYNSTDMTDEKKNILFSSIYKMYEIQYQINGKNRSFSSENLIEGLIKKGNKYYYQISKSQNENFNKLLYLLKKWIKIANYLNIDWWACAGTLLGAIRNKSIIPWDNDIDLSFLYKDYTKLIKFIDSKILNKTNIQIVKSGLGFRLSLKDSLFPFIDLFVYDFNDDKIMSCGPIINNSKYWLGGNVIFPKEYIKEKDLFPLKEISFENLIIKIPNNSVKYLKQIYNENCITFCICEDKDTHQSIELLKLNNIFSKIMDEIVDDNLEDKTLYLDFIQDKLKKLNIDKNSNKEKFSLNKILKILDKF